MHATPGRGAAPSPCRLCHKSRAEARLVDDLSPAKGPRRLACLTI
ncbi:MAG: hypothetical protein OZSIB_2170 [Candidatus Ozemobacter sibiricus]|uniref:Uncharacterized protein n=1 Tax=Candidatus Ozemobacter sibiricus TaxID=2268124 RepID=A0A367ZVE5_9BACT|nr:MAG: hypothetical protein OZSIB_2170 [Candidatus Ozemobacter sibiricus]